MSDQNSTATFQSPAAALRMFPGDDAENYDAALGYIEDSLGKVKVCAAALQSPANTVAGRGQGADMLIEPVAIMLEEIANALDVALETLRSISPTSAAAAIQ